MCSHLHNLSSEVWQTPEMVFKEILNMNYEKKDLMAIDDFKDDLPEIINWAINLKNDDEMADGFKPLE